MKNKTDGERYFVVGLLHDIGGLVMCLQIPDKFRIAMDFARKSGDYWYKAEAKYFGFDHCGVGGALLRPWNLPERLQKSVAHHHNPSATKNYGHEAAVIIFADHISHEIADDKDDEHPRCKISPYAWKRLNLQEANHKSIIKERCISNSKRHHRFFCKTPN
jgi:HD-like signal output (HDOD) protein